MYDAPQVCRHIRCSAWDASDSRIRKIEKSYLVFVVIKDVRQGEELTIDYHPNLGVPMKGKGKRKRRESDGCMCDAKLCRGMRP